MAQAAIGAVIPVDVTGWMLPNGGADQMTSDAEKVMSTYRAPDLVRYWPYIALAGAYVILVLIVLGHYRGWFARPAPAWQVAALAAWGALFTAGTLWVVCIQGRREVLWVEWNDERVVLHPRRGRPVSVPWPRVAYAVVPHEEPEAERYSRGNPYLKTLRLALADREPAYRIPLSWNADCKAFLAALDSHTATRWAEPDRG